MSKVTPLGEAVAAIPVGSTVMIGGFMGVGSPHRLIDELVRQNKGDLTIIANDTARPGFAIGKLIDAHLAKKVIASHIGTNPETQRQMIAGELEVELVPQGTLAERIRAGGYGLGGILTTTGVGTVVEEGKQSIELHGKKYLVEEALCADVSLVNAFRADHAGNLEYELTARNFNPLIAMASNYVIAEAISIVPVGTISPDVVVTPSVVVDAMIANEPRQLKEVRNG